MSRKFIFTCEAASYTLPGGAQYVKGQRIELVEDDPRMHLLKGNAAWSMKAGPEVRPRVAPPADTDELVELFGRPIAAALKTAGYATRSDLEDAGLNEEELLAIKGIGKASAKSILNELI